MNRKYTNIAIAGGLILIAIFARIANTEVHIYNFAPVAALGLFSGAIVKDKRFAFLFTLIAQLVSDLYIQFFTGMDGFYGLSQVFVYGGMMLVTLLGTKMGQPKALKVFGYSIAGSAIFFIVSNLGVWLQGWYGVTFSGLVVTFTKALPFYSEMGTRLFYNSFVGDIIFSGLLFGAYHLLQQVMSKQLVKKEA